MRLSWDVLDAVQGERRITELAMRCEYGIAYGGEIYWIGTDRTGGCVISDSLLGAASGNKPALALALCMCECCCSN